MPEPLRMACPLCGADDPAPVKRFPDGVEVGRCRVCGLFYTPVRHPTPEGVLGRPDAETAEARYGRILRGEARHYRAQAFGAYLDRIERHGPPGRRLLDVGCAHGLFGAEAMRRGYRVTGIEPDPSMAALARRQGLEVLEGLVGDVELGEKAFDVATFTDSLEYVPDPRGALEKVREHLAPRGLLFVRVPNAQHFFLRHRVAAALGRDPGAGEAFGPSARVAHYDAGTLRRLAEAAGFQVEEVGVPLPIHSPRWKDGAWSEETAPWRSAPTERTLRSALHLAGRLELGLRGGSGLAPAVFLVGRVGA